MPIEIREIVIKTVVESNLSARSDDWGSDKASKIKNQILEECRKMINNSKKKTRTKR